jgi:hypothetical protein
VSEGEPAGVHGDATPRVADLSGATPNLLRCRRDALDRVTSLVAGDGGRA